MQNETIKTLNSLIEVENIEPAPKVTGFIVKSYDDHNCTQLNLTIELYVRLDCLSKELRTQISKELKNLD